MDENLLFIIKTLLNQLDQLDFTKEEKEYILSVVRKTIFILLIELRRGNYVCEK